MTSYPADLAERVHERLVAQRLKSPGILTLTALFEILYFTSLKTEEGRSCKFSVTYSDPEDPDPKPPPRIRAHRWKHIALARTRLFTVRNVSKLAKAIDPWSSSLAVYPREDGRLCIWGLVDQIVHFNRFLVREFDSGFGTPGLFQAVVQGPADIAVYRRYDCIARLNQASIIIRQNDVFGSGPISKKLMRDVMLYKRTVAKSVGISLSRCLDYWEEEENRLGTLCRILVNIQQYRQGGAVLISPTAKDLNFKYALEYSRLSRALVRLAVNQVRFHRSSRTIHEEFLDENEDSIPVDLYLDCAVSEAELRDSEAELTGCVRFVSALSCIDGLVHLRPDFTLDGFGAEITVAKEIRSLYRASSAGCKPEYLKPVDFNHYGMRHRSMMRYCEAYPDSVGFVVSQDGDIRAMTIVGRKLVMWENVMIHFLQDAYMKRVTKRIMG